MASIGPRTSRLLDIHACSGPPFVHIPAYVRRVKFPRRFPSSHGNGGRAQGPGGGGGGGGALTGFWEHRDPQTPLFLRALLLSAGLIAARKAKDAMERPAWLTSTEGARVSIIVPVLNEERQIEATLEELRQLEPAAHEVIIVDGGSTDRTVQLAHAAGATVLQSGKGRALQMNYGAQEATGDILCFLHADSTPPRNLVAVVRKALADGRTVLGGFRTVIKVQDRPLIFMTIHQYLKTYYLPLLLRPLSFFRGVRCLFGDQTLFCRASDFHRVGGFDGSLPIMEDADLCIRLHEAGPQPPASAMQTSHPASSPTASQNLPLDGLKRWAARRGQVVMIHNPHACTSGRRLHAWGGLHATAVHFVIGLSWYSGASPQQMRDIYARLYTDNYR
ncbi:probable glucosyl-3-phosphoglycerate synthase at N-terminal half [Coccomyxa sp. Obi]|nr:probable glucosyl-3-phosphoglycerate synthase at N-terminal half [Coccomyxa sp. Obi]